ncbi:hypothetical protein VNO78_14430 [Psophocarpus tetragonolobus]|uniref:Uncharacterized protein n=1 Tax=Psophocarpus tetragonolobus TaxID=3891 RepID=A0AAN9SR49_PSOTE
MNGKVSILQDFASSIDASLNHLTKEDETVCHLAVRHGWCDALEFLVHVSSGTNLLHCLDCYSNTALHLAVIHWRYKSVLQQGLVLMVVCVKKDITLFTSLSIVIVLVSIIPFRRKPHMRLLAFLPTGYILPHSTHRWNGYRLCWLSGHTLHWSQCDAAPSLPTNT